MAEKKFNEMPELALELQRISAALERIAPIESSMFDEQSAHAFVLEASTLNLRPVETISAVPLSLLKGIDRSLASLLENTKRFSSGYSANNALLWGARGMGKSSLVKACHGEMVRTLGDKAPALIEIHREDIALLPKLLERLRPLKRQFILFCDDLSFSQPDKDFKALKSVLEGGLDGRPTNVIFYATANRRHLLPRDMVQNEQSTAINPMESVDETLALSDRFGLWLGFYPCDQADYLAMLQSYIDYYDIPTQLDDIKGDALEWSKTRGSRSGRVAWQYIQNLAGQHKMKLG